MDRSLNIKEYLDRDERKDLLRLLTAGSVDDGKSTLIGRLLYDSKKIYDDQLTALERDSRRMGNAGDHIDYALLCDGLKAEREQGITIDVAYRYFSTNRRKFIIADTPGHEQYTRNMITGGSTASLAIILVDARYGVQTQTRRHTFLVSLLGIRHVVLAVNKMDLVGYGQKVFDDIVGEYMQMAAPLGIDDIKCIPISALEGDNVVALSRHMPWYEGVPLLQHLEDVAIDSDYDFRRFRMPVQYVLRPDLDFRGYCGKIASGVLHKGDAVMALPSGKITHVKSIVSCDGEQQCAFPPQSVTVTLDDDIDVSRGDMLVDAGCVPSVSCDVECMLVWMDEEPMDIKKHFYLKHTTNTTRAKVVSVIHTVDVNTMQVSPCCNAGNGQDVPAMQLNQISRAVVVTAKPLFFDCYKSNKPCGAFVLIDPVSNNTCAVGMIAGVADRQEVDGVGAFPELCLSRLGIAPEHYDAVERVIDDLQRQGVVVKVIK